jgi:hypothetical protein
MRRLVRLLHDGSLPPALVGLVAACGGADVGMSSVSGLASSATASDTGDLDSSGSDGGESTDDGPVTSITTDPTGMTTSPDTGDSSDTTPDECTAGMTRDCYTGPAGTVDLGMCVAGVEDCIDGMWSGHCQDEVVPGVEACNGEDDDCDGDADEGNPGSGGACATGMPGACANGTNQCQDGALACVAPAGVAEVCGDGIDQNCDGVPDDGCMSCPYVYGHDGESWHYAGAVGGASLLGRPEHAARRRGKTVELAPLWVRLDRARVAADGSVRAKLLVAEDEIAYVDRLALAVVEHPAGTEVISGSALQWSPRDRAQAERFWALPTASMRTAAAATWRGRVDVTAAIAQHDERAVHHDRAGENFYELDFGDVEGGAPAMLVVDGHKLKEARGLAANVRRRAPFVQVQRADGAWHTVAFVPSPRGDRKTVCIDLREVAWDAPRYRVRLWTGTHEGGQAMWYVDRVRLSLGAPTAVQVRELAASSAMLRFCGAPTTIDAADHAHPRWNIDDGAGELSSASRTFGRFTRYGEVAPLLQRADDMMVVMRRGDGVELSFAGVGTAGEGHELSLWLRTELVYKPRVLPGQHEANSFTDRVEPMPHRGMGHYAEGAPARTDIAYQAYLRTWNTREYLPGSTQWGEPRRVRALATTLRSLPLAA